MAGYLWVAGSSAFGGIGDDNTIARSSLVQTVTNGNNWSFVGNHIVSSAAIKSDGTLWLWGRGVSGQLGNNDINSKSSPVQTVAGGTNWSSVAGGFNFTAATKTDGTLWLWGDNGYGQLGNNTTIQTSSPIQTITYGTSWSSIACGMESTYVIKNDSTLWVWGKNNYGQLGINSTTAISSPIQTVTYGTNWNKISAGYEHTAGIKTDGTLWTWGRNTFGQLGDNTLTHRSSPVQTIAGGTNWLNVACGGSNIYGGFTVATKNDGTLWVWGVNAYGQLGDNSLTPRSSPVQTTAFGTNWSSVSATVFNSFAIKKDGTLWTWGRSAFGVLGDNSNTDKSSPVQTVMPFGTWKTVGHGFSLLMAINSPLTLQLTTPSAQAYSGAVFGTQPVISFLDESSNVDTTVSLPVTVSVTSGNATLSGTTTVNASSGVATFTDLKLTGFGQVTLTFASSAGITSVSQTLVLEIPAAVMPKRSETASSVPTSGQLRIGELAINIADQKGYVKKSDGTIVNVFTGLTSGVIQNYMIASGAIIPDGGTF